MRRRLSIVLAFLGSESRRGQITQLADLTWNEECQQYVTDDLEYQLPGHGLYLFDGDGNVIDTVKCDEIALPTEQHYLGFVGTREDANSFQAGFLLGRHMAETSWLERVQTVYEN